MSRHILYAYVDGADLSEIAGELDSRFGQFVNGRKWIAGRPSIVNQRHGPETCLGPEDIPLWDLGLNLTLPDPGTEPRGWFSDIEAVAVFLGALHREFGRDFIVGIADTESGITEDLFDISTESPNLSALRQVIGVSE